MTRGSAVAALVPPGGTIPQMCPPAPRAATESGCFAEAAP
jgi:hypothetical protein